MCVTFNVRLSIYDGAWSHLVVRFAAAGAVPRAVTSVGIAAGQASVDSPVRDEDFWFLS